MFINSEVLLELDGMGFSGDEDGNSDMSSSSLMGRTSARRRASAVRTSIVKTRYLPVTTVLLAESAPASRAVAKSGDVAGDKPVDGSDGLSWTHCPGSEHWSHRTAHMAV